MASPERKIFGCPKCGVRISGFEEACPSCGTSFTKNTLFECPFCGGKVKATANSCPHCEIAYNGFTEEQKETPRKKSIDEVISELEKGLSEERRAAPKTCPKCSSPMTGPGGSCPRCDSAADQEVLIQCPICGTPVGLDAAKCPGCGAEFEEEEPAEQPEPAPEEPVETCPVCERRIRAGLRACPECGATLEPSPLDELDEILGEIPGASEEERKTRAALKAERAQASLAKLAELAKEEGIVTTPAPEHRVPGIGYSNGRGTTNGLSNGRGSVNGLSNGRGAVNGRAQGRVNGRVNGRTNGRINGRVNGRINGRINGRTNGRTNGQNLVNGTGVVSRGRGRRAPGGPFGLGRILPVPVKWQITAIVVVIALVVSTFAYFSLSKEGGPYDIDGDFDDWDDFQMLTAATTAGSPSIDVQEWAVAPSGEDLYLYLMTEGDLFSTEDVESVFLFVDSDGSSDTGYQAAGIGAEFMVELGGWNGSVMMSYVSEYSSSSDRYDWNSWTHVGRASHAMSDQRLEVVAHLGVALGPSHKVLLIAQDCDERVCSSFPVSPSRGTLVVKQYLYPAYDDAGILPRGGSVTMLRLVFTSQGAGGSITQVVPQLQGVTLASSVQPFDLGPGQERVVDVPVDTSLSLAGGFASAYVTEDDIQSTFEDVCVIGNGARAYVEVSPTGIEIDGAFGDWNNLTSEDIDLLGIANPNIDVRETGAVSSSADSFFYISVEGTVCCGKCVPAVRSIPVQGSGTPVTPARKTGEDFLRVYIDSDMSVSSGLRVSGTEKTIGADMMIEVRGIHGTILERQLYEYLDRAWSPVTATILAENDYSRIEIGVDSHAIGVNQSFEFIVEATDWRGRSDRADTGAVSLSALAMGVLGGDDLKRWIVDSTTTSSAATALSYQRKLFYDGTNFWSFYFDGSNTVYRYSSDGGQSWSSTSQAFKTSGVNEVSIWYDSGENLVYAVGDTSSASVNVYVQRGVVNPGSHSITWASSDSTCAVSALTHASKNSYISKDADEYIWILATNKVQNSPAKYDMTVFKSVSTDSISSWSSTGSMLDTDRVDDILYGMILPAGSGSDMWAIYNYDMRLSAREYTSSSWGEETLIYNGAGGAADFIQVAPASALVDTNKVVHIVYGDSYKDGTQSKPNIYYTYNTGSGWQTPIEIDDVANTIGNKYPTISLDSSTGNLFAFWIQMNNNNIVCKKNVSGSWSEVSLGSQTSDTKQYLTSVYSVSGEGNICWQWTQNTSSPIHVVFDKIPEFDDIVIPVFLIIIVFVMASRTNRKGRRRRVREASLDPAVDIS
jgi:hypothetical protein